MQRYEYKTIAIDVTGERLRGSLVPDLQEELNRYAARGWRLVSVIPPSLKGFSKSIAVFERRVEASDG